MDRIQLPFARLFSLQATRSKQELRSRTTFQRTSKDGSYGMVASLHTSSPNIIHESNEKSKKWMNSISHCRAGKTD